ncbi:MAG: xanthine dehydrogenase family protein subunit M [Actinomycetota bacterium]
MRRLRSFVLHQPASLQEAVSLLADAGERACPLAGGTDLLVDMKSGRVRFPEIVDLKLIEGLDGIRRVEGALQVGPLVRIDALQACGAIRGRYMALWQASRVLASQSIRHLATIGGNLGRASPASDTAAPLLIHGARLVVQSPEGSREIAIDEFHRGPGVSCLAGGEVISAIVLPDPPPRTGTSYLKLGRRGGSCDLAVVGVAAAVTLAQGGTVDSARIALASVAPTPVRAPSAEAVLVGGVPDDTALESAGRAAVADISPISDVRASAEYRRELAAVLTVRALKSAVATARGQIGPR